MLNLKLSAQGQLGGCFLE